MKELVIASNNAGKIRELAAMLPGYRLLSLSDVGFYRDIPEPYETFEENAAVKAQTVADWCGKDTLADDSGICVEALGGAPGVHSARYSGAEKDDLANLQKLLHELEGKENRRAYYIAVICLVVEGSTHFFEGRCYGTIATAPLGDGGFGYDPVFVPDGYNETFGQLPPEVKHRLSHRGEAVRKALDFLNTHMTLKK